MPSIDTGRMMNLVLACESKQDAKALVYELAMLSPFGDGTEQVRRVRADIGYLAGYLDRADADRIFQLFDTEHPFWGTASPSFHEALMSGIVYGRLSEASNSDIEREHIVEEVRRRFDAGELR